MGAARNLPRPIRAELVEVGDTIEVTLPKTAGMVIVRKGVVSALGRSGNVRQLLTSEGGILCAWEPGVNTRASIVLHKRADVPQAPLFDFTKEMDILRERLA